MVYASPQSLLDGDGPHVVDDGILPSHEIMPVYLATREESLARKLWDIAEESKVFHQAKP